MTVTPLPSETRNRTGYNYKIVVDYTDIDTAAATSDVLQLLPNDSDPLAPSKTFPAGFSVNKVAVYCSTAFAEGGDRTTLTVTIGDGTSAARFGTFANLLGVTGWKSTSSEPVLIPRHYAAADGLDATFTLSGGSSGNLSGLTAGQVEIYVDAVDLNGLLDV